MRIQTELQKKIFKDFLAGKKYTETKFCRYSIRHNPASAVHVWIIRQKKIKDAPPVDAGQCKMGITIKRRMHVLSDM